MAPIEISDKHDGKIKVGTCVLLVGDDEDHHKYVTGVVQYFDSIPTGADIMVGIRIDLGTSNGDYHAMLMPTSALVSRDSEYGTLVILSGTDLTKEFCCDIMEWYLLVGHYHSPNCICVPGEIEWF